MNEFERYNPIVNFLYFAMVIGFSMVLMHPVSLAISLVCAFAYSIFLNGKRAVKFNFCCLVPMLILAALINPAFNHEGVTIITYLPSGNPLTAQSIIYGISAAVMLCSVICWFSCWNKIMTSDKMIYLFGRIIPSLSLVISMTVRFVPRFKAQLKCISHSQRCIGRDASEGSIIKRAKNGITILSIMITWALENSIETARSMKSRGYGLRGRSAFAIYGFDRRDALSVGYIVLLAVYIIIGAARGEMYFRYFPSMKSADVSAFGISVFAAYFMLCIMPVVIEFAEVRKWNVIKSKA